MPVMDGHAFLSEIKTTPFANTPVIAVTASKEAASEEKVLEAGAWDFISKPYEPTVLLARLKNVITRSQYDLLQKMKHVYEHDSLTDLYNRTCFFNEARRVLSAHSNQKFVMLRFDIDNFHMLNAFWGEKEGDRFLRFLADGIRRMSAGISPCVYGRISGDVFAMMFPYDMEYIHQCLKSAVQGLANYNRNYMIKPSAGVYVIDDSTLPIDGIYEKATTAAQTCKGKYETYLHFYEPRMSEQITREQRIVNEMQNALEQEQFEVYLQPKYNLETETPYGAEALVRWNHPEKGLISPGVFIPVFERNGFIGKIDYYMWEKVCALLRRWLDGGKTPAPVSVNVSRINMYNPNLTDVLTDLIGRYKIPADLLNLEITESAYMEEPELMKKAVLSLQNAGFTVMMDDFGSGYSSLNTLKDIPVDVLKIDMKFLSPHTAEGRNECILAAIVRMAGWLGIPVIMEGVETQQQVQFLRSIGCGYVQGFYYAKPMPVNDYEKLLEGKHDPALSLSDNHEAMFRSIWADFNSIELLFDSLNVPIAIYERSEDNILVLRVNGAFANRFGYGSTPFESMSNMREMFAAQQAERLLRAFRSISAERPRRDCTVAPRDDPERSIQLQLRYWGRNEKDTIIFASFSERHLEPEYEKMDKWEEES
jgi:diguanylate cyclase (GGDEF)-like protein